MTIKYTLENYYLTGGNGLRARVHATHSVDLDGIADLILRQGSTVTRADVLSVLHGFEVAVVNVLLEGGRVNTPLANYWVSIKGIFEQGNLDFDAGCHRVVGTISQGKLLKAALRERSKVIRVKSRQAAPRLLVFTDFETEEQNATVTPGGMAQVVGDWLKFDRSDPRQGIFFIPEAGDRRRVPVVGYNKPGKLMFVAPADLAPAEYSLVVWAAFGDGELRSGTLDAVLTV
jgi:hypothetical protein